MATKIFQDTRFIIDRPKGYVKKWPGGKSFQYPCDYGYFPRLKGEDNEGLDAFVGDDPNGHYECFQKLTSDLKSLDETKFLVGVSDRDREIIYKLYGPEVHARRIFRDMDHLKGALGKFEPKKKERYVSKEASIPEGTREVLARYKLSGLKAAEIEKLIRGNILGFNTADKNTIPDEGAIDQHLSAALRAVDSSAASVGEESGQAQAPLEGTASF